MPKVMFRDVADFGNASTGLNLLRPSPGLPGLTVVSLGWMDVTFVWDAVGGADSYQLEIGTTSGGTEYSVTNVGNVLTYTTQLPPGTYYTRVKAVTGGTPGAASAEQVYLV